MNELRTKKEVSLPEKLAKQRAEREKLLKKKNAIEEKIILIEKSIEEVEESIEKMKAENTIKLIKEKGYSLEFINEVVESGILNTISESVKTEATEVSG